MLPELKLSASDAGGPGHTDGKWAFGTEIGSHSWNRVENLTLLECYYSSNRSEKGCMQRMWDKQILRNPTPIK